MLYINDDDECALCAAIHELCDNFTIIFNKLNEREQEKIKKALSTIKNRVNVSSRCIYLEGMYFAGENGKYASIVFSKKTDAENYVKEYMSNGKVIRIIHKSRINITENGNNQ